MSTMQNLTLLDTEDLSVFKDKLENLNLQLTWVGQGMRESHLVYLAQLQLKKSRYKTDNEAHRSPILQLELLFAPYLTSILYLNALIAYGDFLTVAQLQKNIPTKNPLKQKPPIVPSQNILKLWASLLLSRMSLVVNLLLNTSCIRRLGLVP
jgi:hypothetical protein